MALAALVAGLELQDLSSSFISWGQLGPSLQNHPLGETSVKTFWGCLSKLEMGKVKTHLEMILLQVFSI